ncbi:hypothetical protein COU58_00680 [Candidatus Pacearchaeota archaeon CG10_big_fil_rev_8_21_14_0_10_32_42]|nr:MAG: hypothetical protein COU58_00680 [Candidatus Pacearchaeota archaeon CG10_big_fil_rev_8_21_14_0_10_32_42]
MVKEEEYLLTNQEILGGIKSALGRGENLKQAMMSFYQAGYKKEEIEDAARAYLYLQRGIPEENVLAQQEKSLPKNNKESDKKLIDLNTKKEEERKNIERIKQERKFYGTGETKVPLIPGEKLKEIPKVVQKISGYESHPNPEKGKIMTLILVITLIILLGILSLVFLFKAELINFINGLFG